MAEEEPTGTPQLLTFLVDHKEAVLMGLALLATLVAVSYSLELRRQMNSPALQKLRTKPCNCDETEKATTTVVEANGTQEAKRYSPAPFVPDDETVYGGS